jgi:hypothetical protein
MKIEIRNIIYINKRSKWLVLLTLFFVLFSSCNNDNAPNGESGSGKTATVRLTFTASSPKTTRALSSNESKVNDITVLIFNSNGNVIGSNYQTFTTSPYSMIVTTRFANNCTIYAIANTGSSSYFSGVSTLTAFKAEYTTLTTAADLGTGNSVIMFGKNTTTVNITASTQGIGSIVLARLCTKLNFTITPASGTTITGYQLCHVPMSSYITNETSSSFYNHGGIYGDFTAVTGLTSTSAVSPTYYMYENLAGINNNSTAATLRTSTYAPANATYLLVYATVGSRFHSTYCIYLGGTSSTDYTNYSIPRNYNYAYNITINGSGKNDTRVTYTTDAPQIGDYYYSDGTWGTTTNPTGRTVIGIIFQNSTSRMSATEKNKGWTHGYVMAATDASASSTWGPQTDAGLNKITTISSMYNDLANGYSGTQTYGSNSNYQAFYYAKHYGTSITSSSAYASPSGTSGWYLPTTGQWWDIFTNLGGVNLSSYQNSSSTFLQVSTSTTMNSINNKLNNATGASELSPSYWTASECNSDVTCRITLYSSSIEMNTNSTSSDYGNKFDKRHIRAVLAF